MAWVNGFGSVAGLSSGGGSTMPTAGPGQSISSSFIPDYPQSPLLQSIAEYASKLGDATYNWGQQQFAKTSNLTDQNINSYLTTSARALANAQNDEDRYRTLFQPEENQLVADANSYNSTARQQYEMGRAEAQAGKTMDAARQNHLRELQSYGVDPSSGRYDELDRADQLAKSAAQVGAGQHAYENTAATGRQLRADAIQAGERYPGQITNEQNTALQGYAGAENSNLANANTGLALQNAANPYLQTAESLKYPPLGQQSSSMQGGGGGGGSNGGGNGDKPPTSPGGSSGAGPYQSGGGGGGGGVGGGSSSQWSDAPTGNGSEGEGFGLWDGGSGTDYTGADSYPFSDASGGWGDAQNYSDSSYAPSDGSVFDTGSGTDMSSYGDYGGGDYARGGPVPSGGRVPQAMSPSGGQRVDDIPAVSPGGPARLNANEFVVPQDVALWKGQEFFQKLIADARKNNAMAAAKPRMQQGPR